MAPFNLKCKTCGEYIAKAKKFNARQEYVKGEDYLGIKIIPILHKVHEMSAGNILQD